MPDRPPLPPSYRCPRCGLVSYNPNDVRERYCGFCHVFEDDRERLDAAIATIIKGRFDHA